MSGTGTAAATSIILTGLVIGLILAQPSLDQASDDLRGLGDDNTGLSLELANTDISFTSAVFNNTTSVINATIKNTGSSVLDVDDIDILLNGTWARWTIPDTEYIYPGMESVARITNATEPFSLKIVVRNGISAHTSDIVEVT